MSSSSEYRTASDGLLARVSGDWAIDKLYYVQRYMSIFNSGMKNLWRSRVYVDLLAGPGRCILRESPEEFDGSPLLALKCKPHFSDMVFVESDERLVSALRARVLATGGRQDMVETADANSPALAARIRDRFSHRALGLLFVDFLGMEVSHDTLGRLTTGRKIDLLITFQVSDITRNIQLVMRGDQDPKRWDDFFGSSVWRAVVGRFEHADTTSPDLAAALTDFYCGQLKTLGYTNVEAHKRLMRNTTSAPLYRLILAAKHERAIDFFQKISKIESDGQRGFSFD